MRIALIANSRSKEVKNQTLSPALENKFLELNIRFDLFTTRYHGHAFEMMQQISIGEYDAIVTMGGDGTNYQVLNGILKYHGNKQLPPLGILPVGRGNSFAKDLQIFSIEDGLVALSRQATRKVDVCRFSQNDDAYYFVNLMGFGFVTDVAGVFHRLLGLNFHDLVLEIDGKIIRGKNCFVEICNSRYTGGNMLMAPDAQIDDGLFDAVVLAPLSRLSLISTFPKIFNGTHSKKIRPYILSRLNRPKCTRSRKKFYCRMEKYLEPPPPKSIFCRAWSSILHETRPSVLSRQDAAG
jgi:diacylglycerol kinase family enzyme